MKITPVFPTSKKCTYRENKNESHLFPYLKSQIHRAWSSDVQSATHYAFRLESWRQWYGGVGALTSIGRLVGVHRRLVMRRLARSWRRAPCPGVWRADNWARGEGNVTPGWEAYHEIRGEDAENGTDDRCHLSRGSP